MIRLQQLRIDAKLTPRELGERSGVSHATVLNIEKGKGAKVETLHSLADALNADGLEPPVRPSELLLPVDPTRAAA